MIFGLQRKIAAGQADAIELQLQVALAPEVAGILGRLEMADQVASAGKGLLAELGDAAQMAEHGIADVGRGGGEVGFIEGTLQKSTGGQDDIARAGAQAQAKNEKAQQAYS